jgi:hypothetical protein
VEELYAIYFDGTGRGGKPVSSFTKERVWNPVPVQSRIRLCRISSPPELAGETRGSASVATCPGPPGGRAGWLAEPYAEGLLQ